MMRKVAKVLGAGTVACAGGTAAWAYSDEGVYRSFKCCAAFTPMFCDYSYRAWADADLVPEQQQQAMNVLHAKYAPESLDILLDLGGYYVKAGQTMVGAGQLPKQYEECFQVLLDDCPAQPFETIKSIVERELGKPIGEVFSRFDEKPIGAASIGQVHLAELRGGGEVVVKVQYPEVEAHFRMDVETMKVMCAIAGDYGDAVNDIMDDMAKTFENEFDYKKEAAMLRQCAQNLPEHFKSRVFIPLPFDAEHPDVPAGTTLCTSKVMAMERVPGLPIKKQIKCQMAQYAESQSMTVKQLEDKFKAEMQDPEKLKQLLSSSPTSEAAFTAAAFAVRLTDALVNFWRMLRNWSVIPLMGRQQLSYQQTSAPINGPRITKLLFDVHAHQIFHDGIFNSDPHAGNVIAMPDGRLGLIDYGAACLISRTQRKAFAELFIAVDQADDEKTFKAFIATGFRTKKMSLGDQATPKQAAEMKKFCLIYALFCFEKGYNPESMKRAGVPDGLGIMELDEYLNSLDSLQKCPSDLFTVQRCAEVLMGIAQETGAGSVSVSQMWRAEAERYLAKH